MDYVIPAPPVVALAVDGDERRFPVRRVFCVGRNYAAHAREMGHDPDREPPFFFTKPADALVPHGATIPYPLATRELHHEVELVVALGKGGADISPAQAPDCIFGYAVCIDLTRRDLQAEAKKLARPWDVGKAFDQSAPCSAIVPAVRVSHPERGRILLAVNGITRQDGDLAQMIWSTPEVIAHLSRLFTLAPGDLIFTGTPAGVGPVERGDVLDGQIEGVGDLQVRVV